MQIGTGRQKLILDEYADKKLTVDYSHFENPLTRH